MRAIPNAGTHPAGNWPTGDSGLGYGRLPTGHGRHGRFTVHFCRTNLRSQSSICSGNDQFICVDSPLFGVDPHLESIREKLTQHEADGRLRDITSGSPIDIEPFLEKFRGTTDLSRLQ